MYWLFLVSLFMLGYSIFTGQGVIAIVVSAVMAICMLMFASTSVVASEDGLVGEALASKVLALISGGLFAATIFTHELACAIIGLIIFLIAVPIIRKRIKSKSLL